uniref:SRCR domain-containing protein n=1 Tax=Gopherus agassizii TaxID=38772 RepID=A0A452GKS6_9SAUR
MCKRVSHPWSGSLAVAPAEGCTGLFAIAGISLFTLQFISESDDLNSLFMNFLLEFTDLRLVSDSDCAGRLEVFYNGTWGSVCSNQISGDTPTIVCKQLNCGDRGQIERDFEYGAGSGPTWLDHVACSEQHGSLWQCPSEPWDPKSCDNRTHIDVSAFPDQEKLRVVGGEDRCSGRVEVWYRGSWGTVCDDSWDMADANVVCKQLGCGSVVSAPAEAAFGEGTGPIWVEKLNSMGVELSAPCNSVLSLILGADELRLMNGSSPCAGRVEVKHQEQWGTVCDDGWDMAAAGVVCKQLGCGVALSAHLYAHFGEGSGQIWLDNTVCRGNESAVWACEHNSWGDHNCDHREDAGVTCSGRLEPQLIGGNTACSGRVEIRHGDTWTTVCDSHLDLKAASVICKELDCGTVVSTPGGAHFSKGYGSIWSEKIHCMGNETRLVYCPRALHPNETCSHSSDASIVCSGYGGYRLTNGSTRCSGRVELLHGGIWGTLCDSQWDLQAAHTLCQQFDCGFAMSIPAGQLFGTGDGYVWNGTFGCERNESRLRDCPVTALGCSDGRLVNGTECSGRVEIRHGVTWGSLCASHWDLQDANVLCHQLNCGYAKSIQGGAHFGEGSGTVWSDTFHCEGTESCLWDCSRMALGNPACSPRDTARVICSGVVAALQLYYCSLSSADKPVNSTIFNSSPIASLRLLNGESQCDGRVEISLHDVWDRVLDDQWDMNDASVVCRQLQCGVAEKAYNPPKSERGTGPVGLRRVQCAGNETRLTLCDNSTSETAQAGIAEDVGVICSGSRRIRLVNGTGRCAGRVEIYYNGSWGTVCDDSWDLSDSNVICKQLGCGHAINATISAHYGIVSNRWDFTLYTPILFRIKDLNSFFVHFLLEFTDLRLVSDSDCAGRLEVFYNGTWGSVCSNGMPGVTAAIVCKQLNCGDGGQIARDFAYGEGSGPTWLDHVACSEQHRFLWQCPSGMWKQQSCDNRAEETHISCSGNSETVCTHPCTLYVLIVQSKNENEAHGKQGNYRRYCSCGKCFEQSLSGCCGCWTQELHCRTFHQSGSLLQASCTS